MAISVARFRPADRARHGPVRLESTPCPGRRREEKSVKGGRPVKKEPALGRDDINAARPPSGATLVETRGRPVNAVDASRAGRAGGEGSVASPRLGVDGALGCTRTHTHSRQSGGRGRRSRSAARDTADGPHAQSPQTTRTTGDAPCYGPIRRRCLWGGFDQEGRVIAAARPGHLLPAPSPCPFCPPPSFSNLCSTAWADSEAKRSGIPGSDTWRGAGGERSRGRRDHAAQRREEGRAAGGGMKRERREGAKCWDGGKEGGWHGGGRQLTGSSLARHAGPTGPGRSKGIP